MNQGGQGPSRVFDEFAKLMTDAAGVAQGARREVEGAMRSQAERFMQQMDLVQRDEFEAVKEMASKARMENEELRAEIAALKELVQASAKKPAARKPAAKKAPAAKASEK
ncbi:MAG: accessory factor UbiK family protein [Rhizobiaceae bacterium]|nr:accessory factor UbiK family protein [Hyphomicrobiales bacterium]NRB31274.1 accessory factor UbiK family protein [Rhizobiaceae bacterium]